VLKDLHTATHCNTLHHTAPHCNKQVSLLRVIKDLHIPILPGDMISYQDTFKACVRRVLAGFALSPHYTLSLALFFSISLCLFLSLPLALSFSLSLFK